MLIVPPRVEHSEHRGEKWQLNCKRTEHSLTLDILFGQDLCLWHHLTSWMDQDSLVEVIPFHPHPRSHHLSCHCLCQSFLGKNWQNRERRTSFPESKKISLFLLSLGRLPSFFFSALAHCCKEQKIRIKRGLLSKWELSLGITLKELNVLCFEMILISSYGGDIPITSGLILDMKSLIKQWDEITILLHINYFIRILNPHWWKYIR